MQSTRILGLSLAYAIKCCTCMNGMHAVPPLLHVAFPEKLSDEEKELFVHSLLSIFHFDIRIRQQEIVRQSLLLVLRTHLWTRRLLDGFSLN